MNLFSFQDIIMSVMGILLLITLLLALFLVTPSKANLANSDAISKLETALASKDKELGLRLESSFSYFREEIEKGASKDSLGNLLKETQRMLCS